MGDRSRPRRVRVRRAVAADRDPIAALDALGDPTRRLLATDLHPDAPRHAVVAVAGTAPVGFAMATAQADAAHVLDVAVAHGHRRRGVATALLRHLAGAVHAAGTPAMTLEVRASNGPARALYTALGFRDVGVRPGYYTDGEDAHVLWHHDLTTLAAGAVPDAAPAPRVGE